MSAAERSRFGDDHGAILVYAAFGLIGLIAFSAIVIDYGVLWTARRQIQNAADSGALAAAVSMAFDDPARELEKPAQSAIAIGQAHSVWGTAPSIGSTDISYPDSLAKTPSACTVGIKATGADSYFCARVNAYRDKAHDNPLPTFFGSLLGLTSQDVKATATAISIPANATDCLTPFVIADRFDLLSPSGDPGYRYYGTFGRTTSVYPLLQTYSTTTTAYGSFRFLVRGASPATVSEVQRAVRACTSDMYAVHDDLTTVVSGDPTLGATIAAAMPGVVADIIKLDPGASWDDYNKLIVSSCVLSRSCLKYDAAGSSTPVPDPEATFNPRIIVLPIVDPNLEAVGQMQIVNFMALFVTGINGAGEVQGVLMARPGKFLPPPAPQIRPDASFLRTVQLIR